MSSGADRASGQGQLSISVTRPVGVVMAVLAVCIFGLVSLGQLSQTLLPDISYPTLTVRTEFPGATPDDVDERVTRRLQEELATVPGLVRVSSVSRAEISDIFLEFQWDTKITFAVQDVTEKINSVFLPDSAETPIVLRYDPNLDPIMRIGISGNLGLRELRDYVEKTVKEELESTPGVAAVRIRGGDEKEYRVHFRAAELRRYEINAQTLSQLIAAQNLNATGGLLREGDTEYLVRTQNEFEGADDIRNLYLRLPSGVRVQLRDLADIAITDREREIMTRIDGKTAVEIAIYRSAESNIVDTAGAVVAKVFGSAEQRAYVAEKSLSYDSGFMDRGESKDRRKARAEAKKRREMTNYLEFKKPKGVEFSLLTDQSKFIKQSVSEVRDSALIGGVLAIIVLYLFLRRLASTLIIAISIPISIAATFAPMHMAGVTLNVMSLGGLALGIGMLVDNSIVVLESITRLREKGLGLIQSTVQGTRQVSSAVVASTLTTVAVFFPIVFVEGVAGQIFGDQSIAVVSSLAISLAVALFFIPVLASLSSPKKLEKGADVAEREVAAGAPKFLPKPLRALWLAVPWILRNVIAGGVLFVLSWIAFGIKWLGIALWQILRALLSPATRLFDLVYGGIQLGYPHLLRGALRLRLLVLLLSGTLLYLALVRVPDLGTELLPEVHQGEFTLEFGLESDVQLEQTDRIVREIDREIRALQNVDFTVAVMGTEREELRTGEEGPHIARVTVKLTPGPNAIEREVALEKQVRTIIAAYPEVRTQPKVLRPTLFSLSTPVEIEIRGKSPEVLTALSRQVEKALGEVEGLEEVRSSLREGKNEIRVSFLREELILRDIGIDEATEAIKADYQGLVASQFNEGDRRIPIRLIAPEELRWSVQRLQELEIRPGIPLSAIASIDIVKGPAEVRRIGSQRAAVVSAIPEKFDLGTLAGRIENAILDVRPPVGYDIRLGGQTREMESAQQSMQFALLLAIFLVYVVMASQFESLLQPFLILGSVPLALIGVIFALAFLNIPLSVIVFIGMIMLAGIVVNNAIVLVDRANQNRDDGMSVQDAIVQAGKDRLRPILMTTATTVLGLLPLTGLLPQIDALGLTGEGAELRAPMAITVIAGLLTSTLLTLIVIPVLYSLTARFHQRRTLEA